MPLYNATEDSVQSHECSSNYSTEKKNKQKKNSQRTTSVWAPIDSKSAESWTIFSIAAVDRMQYKKINPRRKRCWREIHQTDALHKVVRYMFKIKQPNLVSSVYWVDRSLFAGHRSRYWPIAASVKGRTPACHESNRHRCWISLPKEPE